MSTKSRIIFLILPNTHVLDLAGPMQVFQEAADLGCELSLSWCAYSTDHLQVSSGLPLGSIAHFSTITPGEKDFIIVPGASLRYLLSLDRHKQDPVIGWLKQFHERGAVIGSICTGAFFLAYAGLLDGRKCTTHWKRTAELKQHYPKALVVNDVLFTEDDRIVTSAGVAAGIDLALHIVANLSSEQLAFQVARECVVYLRRNGNQSQHSILTQYRNHIHTGIHRVQDYVQESLEKETSLPALSEVACMSARNLTRIFKRETGVTINEYLNLVRKERLRQMMQVNDYTRKQMARSCGLRSERQVIRLINEINNHSSRQSAL